MQQKLPLPLEGPAPGDRSPDGDWRIDARTRRIGLKGVALVRAALEQRHRPPGQPAAEDSGQPDAA